jgi:hypothetical protein
MPGYLVQVGAVVMCAHGGQAQPVMPLPRVKVMGQPVVAQVAPYLVAGCPFVLGIVPSPCLTAQWLTGSLRVKSMGLPLVLQDSVSVCAPNGTPATIAMTQTRVKGM